MPHRFPRCPLQRCSSSIPPPTEARDQQHNPSRVRRPARQATCPPRRSVIPADPEIADAGCSSDAYMSSSRNRAPCDCTKSQKYCRVNQAAARIHIGSLFDHSSHKNPRLRHGVGIRYRSPLHETRTGRVPDTLSPARATLLPAIRDALPDSAAQTFRCTGSTSNRSRSGKQHRVHASGAYRGTLPPRRALSRHCVRDKPCLSTEVARPYSEAPLIRTGRRFRRASGEVCPATAAR